MKTVFAALLLIPAVVVSTATPALAAPGTPPGAPTQVSAKTGPTETRVAWAIPNDQGSSPITGYIAQAWDRSAGGGNRPLATCSTAGATTCTITGLTAGTTYYIDVTATNGKVGKASNPRVAVTPYAPADELAGVVYFPSHSAELTQKARGQLDAMIPLFARAAAIRVDGYVQKASGGSQTGLGLSKQRAIAVANYIGAQITDRGWDVVIAVKGKGQPATDQAKSTSRRAEIIITGTR